MAVFNDEELDSLLHDFIAEWNIAEGRIKEAELMRDNQVVLPAIFELRYAGRKLVDAFKTAQEADLSSDRSARKAVHRDLADAVENCVRSKHDSIDAVIFFVTKWFADVEKSIGVDEIQKFSPEYFEISGELAEIQIEIKKSREDRHNGRKKIYDRLETGFYGKIISQYQKIKQSKERLQAAADKNRKEKIRDRIMAVSGIFIGTLGLIVGFIGIFIDL